MINNVGMHPGASESYPDHDNSESTPNIVKNTISDSNSDDSREYTLYPKRKNIRAEFHNYSGGDYFVTICTQGKKHYFGEIFDGEMHLSILGEYANQALNLCIHTIHMWKCHCLSSCPTMFTL